MNKGSSTIPVATRLSESVYAIIKRRANKRAMKVSEYIRWLITYDAMRKRWNSKISGGAIPNPWTLPVIRPSIWLRLLLQIYHSGKYSIWIERWNTNLIVSAGNASLNTSLGKQPEEAKRECGGINHALIAEMETSTKNFRPTGLIGFACNVDTGCLAKKSGT